MAIERKYERDIDILLAEEFAVNPAFADHFKALTKFAGDQAQVIDVYVSKSNDLGESDLVVVYQSENEGRFALLIEDKVDAPLQPDQAVRYRQRADRDRVEGNYCDYEVLLCAPRYYIESSPDLLDGFDRYVPYEQIAKLIRLDDDPRAEYRANFLETAAQRRANAWIRQDDPATNGFWDAAYDLATKEFPELEMKQQKVTKNSNWRTIRPHDFPTRPKEVYVSLKGDRGFIDLTFSNTKMFLFQPAVAHLLDPDMTVHQAGASAVIRIQASGFAVADGIEAGLPKLRSAFEAASRLIKLYRNARDEFDKAASAATPA